jgi:hypothetical protein
MKIKNETTMSTALRHLLDFELETNGWSQGDIRLVRRVLTKGAKTAVERRVTQRYQALRREVVALEQARAAEHAAYVARYDVKYYGPDELELIPHAEERQEALELAELWPILVPNVAFPGVKHSYDRHAKDGSYAYYLTGDYLPADLPRMFTKNGRLCRSGVRSAHLAAGGYGYDYTTPKVGSVLSRALRGLPLFVGEVI